MPEKFPAYFRVQRIASTVHNIHLSTCEIADAKQQLGYRVRKAHNRINPRERSKTCIWAKVRIIRTICLDLRNV